MPEPEPGCKCHEEEEKEEFAQSANALKELYTVAVAVALTMGVERLAQETAGPVLRSSQFRLFLAFLFTLIPFYHGAIRHMEGTYILRKKSEKRPHSGVLLSDYLLLVFEAGLLAWLATKLSDAATFTECFLILLGLDIIWAILTLLFTTDKKAAILWGSINAVAIVVLAARFYCPSANAITSEWLLVAALLRSIADYAVCWEFYFPPARSPKPLSGF